MTDETTNSTGAEGQLDRLVDGELNETDRRELLLQFEREPEGWRRCALAFLEAQCWKQELGLMAPSTEAVASASTPVSPDVRPATSSGRASWRQHLATALTLCACFLIALAIGLNFRGGAGSTHNRDSSQVNPATHELNPSDELQIEGLNGETESVRVPRNRHDATAQNIADQRPDAMPQSVQREFERMGNEVVQKREVVPYPLKSGRSLMVPVDHAEIHYVGRGSL
jgi:hypothetical protein